MPSLTKNYRWSTAGIRHAPTCARGSFRVVRGTGKSRGMLLRFCCPRGKWSPTKKRCRVGMRIEAFGTKRSNLQRRK